MAKFIVTFKQIVECEQSVEIEAENEDEAIAIVESDPLEFVNGYEGYTTVDFEDFKAKEND